jgi:hypothetical protein
MWISIMRYEMSVNGYKVITTQYAPIGTMVGYRPVNTKSSGKRLRGCPDFVIHYNADP